MARSRSQAETLLTEVIDHAVTPVLKRAGFQKSGMNYHRRRGEVVQVVNLQVGHGSTALEKLFYVNIYLLGDLDEAWGEVEDLVTLLSDRPNAPGPRWLIERLRLSGLESHLDRAVE
jgi:hypothetical protein